MAIFFCLIQVFCVILSANISSSERNMNPLVKFYVNWHSDTDLQVVAKLLNVSGIGKSNALYLVTSDPNNLSSNQMNRFSFDISRQIAQNYWSSSGLLAVIINLTYIKILHYFFNPFIFLLLLRFIIIIISSYCIYLLSRQLFANKGQFKGPLFSFILFLNPWFFANTSSFFLAECFRFAPIFYLLFLKINHKDIFTIRKLSILGLFLILSTLNGFEFSLLCFGMTLVILFDEANRRHLKEVKSIFMTLAVSICFSFISWFVVLYSYFKDAMQSLNIIIYNTTKHSGLFDQISVPKEALISSDVHVNTIQVIFRVFIQCSLLLPYTLLRALDDLPDSRILTLKIVALLTSPIIVLIYFILTRKLNVTGVLFLLLLLLWIVSIKSYAYHHTHIIGSAILLYICVILIFVPKNNYSVSNLLKRKMLNN
jgi:hypothetical protein